jgi:hypothetical protein
MFRPFCKGHPFNGPFFVPKNLCTATQRRGCRTGSGEDPVIGRCSSWTRASPGEAASLLSETNCVAARASFTINCDLVTRYRWNSLCRILPVRCVQYSIPHGHVCAHRCCVPAVPIVFGNMRYILPALDRRAGACKMMQRGMSTVLLRGKVQTTGMRLLSIYRSTVEAIYSCT